MPDPFLSKPTMPVSENKNTKLGDQEAFLGPLLHQRRARASLVCSPALYCAWQPQQRSIPSVPRRLLARNQHTNFLSLMLLFCQLHIGAATQHPDRERVCLACCCIAPLCVRGVFFFCLINFIPLPVPAPPYTVLWGCERFLVGGGVLTSSCLGAEVRYGAESSAQLFVLQTHFLSFICPF